MSWHNFEYRPYVPVAERQRRAQRELAKLAKKGLVVRPIRIEGRTIAQSFWGKAWCDNLESYMDYANRLPRGRTYVRNGSVVHLEIKPGQIEAMVSGTEMYKVRISITSAAKAKWNALCRECAGGIGSLVELLQGRLSDRVMDVITRKETGLFPSPKEIELSCSCPDWADMCKHVAAVLYGVGARLDVNPELLFTLRSVNHEELISIAATATDLTTKAVETGLELAESEIGAVFGIELDTQSLAPNSVASVPSAQAPKARKTSRKRSPASVAPAPAPSQQSAPERVKAKRARRKPARGRGE
jgi:uncharacterized Zn finger protein